MRVTFHRCMNITQVYFINMIYLKTQTFHYDHSLSTAFSESNFAWLSLSLAFHHVSKLKTWKPSLLASGEQ